MNKLFWGILLFACAAAFCGCAESSEAEPEPETTASETTETTTELTTTEETTTTTTTTTLPYVLAENVVLVQQPASGRPTSCVMELSNLGEEALEYGAFSLYSEDGEPLSELPEEEDEKPKNNKKKAQKAQKVQPGDTAELTFDWSDRYGELEEGNYIFELGIGGQTQQKPETKEDSKEDSEAQSETEEERPTVCRAEMIIFGADFSPILRIDPDSVKTFSVVLSVSNAADQARDYTMVYRVYDSEENLMMSELDSDARVKNTYHFEPGESHDLSFNWSRRYGDLPDGDYTLEIDFIGADDSVTTTYRAPFTVKKNRQG